ncbi:hypothetical protein SEUCBS139899_007841 [Sporothrix eucalyptigena]
MDDTIEVRLPPSIQAAHDEREYSLNRVSPKTAEPRTMPDVPAATRRERDIWGTSPPDRSPRRSPASGYPNLENPEESTQKRKRSPSVEDAAYRQDAQRVRSHQHQQRQRGESDLPRIMTATETAAAAIAAAASAVSGASREKELEPSRASAEPRDSYDLSRGRDYTARSYADEEREQQQRREQQHRDQQHREQQQREQQQREQNRVDLWISQTARDERQSGPSYDNAAYHQRSGSMQSPAEENSANDSRQHEKSVHASASPQSEYGVNSPDDDERPPMYGTPFSPSNQKIGPPLQQTDAKRRKRNFSNRTKTGCLTCRKRKKKCDETKPECSNCVRGGFICAGYPPQKGHWGKPDPTKPTVQIESKDPTYVPPGAYGMPGPLNGVQGGTFHQQRRESLPLYRGQALRIEPPQGRLLLSDDDRPTASTLPSALTSADGHTKLSALSAFSAPANVFPTPVSAATTVPFPDRTPLKEYQRVPPLHELNRGADPETPQLLTPLPQINIHRSGSPSYRQPSQEQNQLPQPQPIHHRQHSQTEPPRPHEGERDHEHEHGIQHVPQNSHPGHQLQSPQPFHAQHPHPAHHQSQPMLEHRSQPPLHRQPRQGPLHQDPMPADRQARFLHQYSPQSHMPPQQQQQAPQQPPQQPLENAEDAPESREAEEARVAARRNVPFFSTVPGPRREKEEMHAGRPFYQFDNELVDARERCVAACWKFNNSTNPNIGVSQSERSRLFKEILQPRGSEIHGPTGAVGEQVVVDAPFHADYGYNISIGNAVHIGRNCHFSDAMPISIGNRVTIGPNVSFFTAAPSTDPMERDGVHSALQGRRITIEDDVFIGGNVTILAGVCIGKGAVVGAGSVVTSASQSVTATLLS